MARKQITSVPLNDKKVIFIITGRNMAFSMAFRLYPRFILSVKEEMSKPKESITPLALGPILQQECLSNTAAYIMVHGLSQSKSRPWAPWALLTDPLLLKQMEGSNKEIQVYTTSFFSAHHQSRKQITLYHSDRGSSIKMPLPFIFSI